MLSNGLVWEENTEDRERKKVGATLEDDAHARKEKGTLRNVGDDRCGGEGAKETNSG